MIKSSVTVVDYGAGNLLGVQRALEYCGASVMITSDPGAIESAERLVLPGVGAFGNAMDVLNTTGLATAIKSAVKSVPLLGICLGMQLILDESYEFGVTKGLGLIAGCVEAIPSKTLNGTPQKVPHIGWNTLVPSASADWTCTALNEVSPGSAVYFVHSYMAVVANPMHSLADCFYGGHRIAAVLKVGNITACQFHPEKSGGVGLKIISNFLNT